MELAANHQGISPIVEMTNYYFAESPISFRTLCILNLAPAEDLFQVTNGNPPTLSHSQLFAVAGSRGSK